jgi:hypothetical protein
MKNLINRILKKMPEGEKNLKVEFYNDEYMCFSLYESEVPIMVNTKTKEVSIEFEGTKFNLEYSVAKEITDIMGIIAESESMEEILYWISDLNQEN